MSCYIIQTSSTQEGKLLLMDFSVEVVWFFELVAFLSTLLMVEGCLYCPAAVMVDPLLLAVKDPSLVLDFPVRIFVSLSFLVGVEGFPARV